MSWWQRESASALLGKAVSGGPHRCLGAIAHIQLPQYGLHMDLDGRLGDGEFAGDHLVRVPGEQVVKHATFAVRYASDCVEADPFRFKGVVIGEVRAHRRGGEDILPKHHEVKRAN